MVTNEVLKFPKIPLKLIIVLEMNFSYSCFGHTSLHLREMFFSLQNVTKNQIWSLNLKVKEMNDLCRF